MTYVTSRILITEALTIFIGVNLASFNLGRP